MNMMPYLFVVRTHGACVNTQILTRACDAVCATILSLVAALSLPVRTHPYCNILS